MRHRDNYGSGDEAGPEFIRCVDVRQPQIHEFWNYREDGVTHKVHPTACIDVGTFVGECFATDHLNPTWRRIPIFGRNYINGSVEWIGVPDLPRNDGPPWTLNILATYDNLGDRGSSTSPNWGSGSGGNSDSVYILQNWPARVLPVYHQRIFENTRSAARCACDDLLMENRTYRMKNPSTFCNPIRGRLVIRRDDVLDDCWDFSVLQ